MNADDAMRSAIRILPVPSIVVLDLADATERVIEAARNLGAWGDIDVTFVERLGTLRDRLAQYDDAKAATETYDIPGRFEGHPFVFAGDHTPPCSHRREDACEACVPDGGAS